MFTADFSSAVILISFGAVLGRPTQYLITALLETPASIVTEYVIVSVLKGLYRESWDNGENNCSVYHSDLFSMVGTIFLWVFWPSFNAGVADPDDAKHRTMINTFLALIACTMTTFLVSQIVAKDVNMVETLPIESLFTVLQFADYKTLVFSKLSGSRFLRLATKYEKELAYRRGFQVRFYFSSVTCDDIQGGSRQGVRYKPYNKASLLAACQAIDGVIGPHAVVSLRFENSTLSIADNSDIFKSAPSLKHAEHVSFGAPTVGHFNALISSLIGTESLVVGFDDDVISRLDWTFLRQEPARQLRCIKVCIVPNSPSEGAKCSIERLIRECTTLPRLQDQDGLELVFKQSGFSGIFALRVIKLLENSTRALTFQMTVKEDGSVLMLNKSDYAVGLKNYATNTITRHTSKKRGIAVEENGRTMSVRSATEVPPKKQSLRREQSQANAF